MCDTKVGLYSRQCLCDSSHKVCVWCEIAFWLWSVTHKQMISITFLLDQKKMLQFEVILIEFNQRWKGVFNASQVWNETHVLKTTAKQTNKQTNLLPTPFPYPRVLSAYFKQWWSPHNSSHLFIVSRCSMSGLQIWWKSSSLSFIM